MHLADKPWLCMLTSGSNLSLAACDQSPNQRWSNFKDMQNPWVLQNQGNNRCLNLDHARGQLITYGCSGGWNEKWYGVKQSQAPWLNYLGANEIQAIARLLQ